MDDGSVSDPTVTATSAVTNGPSGRERGAGPSGRERGEGSNGPEGSNRARWEAAFGRSRLRDADFDDDVGHPARAGVRARRRRVPRRVPVHPRAVRVDVPLEAVDDADVRRLRHGRGHELAVQGDHPRRRRRPLDRVRHADAARARLRRSACRRARSAGAAWPSTRWPTWRTSTPGIDLGAITTSMTINSPAAVIFAMYVAQAERAGVDRVPPRRHAPERHPEGVPGPEGVRVPAAAVDAAGARHDRLHRGGDAALALDLDLRLPHPRGGLDGRRGAGLHARQRLRLRGAGDAGGPARRRVRPPALVLLQRPHRLLRGDRQVPRRPSHLGPLDAGALRRPGASARCSCASTPRPPGCRSPRSSPR